MHDSAHIGRCIYESRSLSGDAEEPALDPGPPQELNGHVTATAVHFGAGNIGRGFVAPFLRQSGYEVVFADVSEELIDALQTQPSYTVREVGEGGRELVIDGYRAINSREHPDAVVAEIARADIVTTAVGVRILQFVAPLIVAGLAQRPA